MPASARVSGSFKNVAAISTRVGGSWKTVTAGWSRVSGVWRQFFSSFQPTFQLLQTATLGSNQTSVAFSNLVSQYAGLYTHLQVRMVFKQNVTDGTVLARINGGAASSTSSQMMSRATNDASQFARNSSNAIALMYTQDFSQAAAESYFVLVIDLVDPFVSGKNKSIRFYGGGIGPNSNSDRAGMGSAVAVDTTQTNSLEFSMGTGASASWQGGSFVTGSRISLYGIRGAT